MNPWVQDLKFLIEQIKAIHPRPYNTYAEDYWNKVIAEVHAKLSSDLPDHLKIAEYFRIVALLADSHSRIALQFATEHREMAMILPSSLDLSYPVRFQIFTDGLYITKAMDTELLGMRVVKIGDTSVEEVVNQLLPYLPIENQIGCIAYLPLFLIQPLFLEAIRLVNSPQEPLQLQGANGQKVLITPKAQPQLTDLFDWQEKQQMEVALKELPKYLQPKPVLSIRKHKDNLIVGIRAIEDTDELTMKQLAEVLDKELTSYQPDDQHPQGGIERLIIDLRDNGGGNNYLNMPLLRTIIKHTWIDQPNRLFVMINRWTFSAAINLANNLERYTWAMFVGEGFSGRINHYGDSTKITLPNSGLIVRVSTLFWQDSVPTDKRLTILPDIPASPTFTDFANRIDVGLQAIESYTPDPEWIEFASKYSSNYKIHRKSQFQDIVTVFGSQPNIRD